MLSFLINDVSGTGDYFLLLKFSGERRGIFFFNENEKEGLSEPRCKQKEKVIICFGLLTASPVPHRIYCLQFKLEKEKERGIECPLICLNFLLLVLGTNESLPTHAGHDSVIPNIQNIKNIKYVNI